MYKYKIVTPLLILSFSAGLSAADDDSFTKKARLPNNAATTCTANISPWFGGQVTANGWVEPANSLDPIFADFDKNTRCDFYKWGAQMFLWLTSGSDNKQVFNDAPGFYNVSVEDKNEKRVFLTNDGPMLLSVRKRKTDNEIELGQAGGFDTLLSQKESLVYYGLHANNVFALYTTGNINQAFDEKGLKKLNCNIKPGSSTNSTFPNAFPNTKADLECVKAFATDYGYPLYAAEALAIELKTSWVDAGTVDKKNYITAKAIVPVFDRATINPTTKKQQWTITGNEEKELALVGMHIVGTVSAHPEMIWATFEHINNAPDSTYTYTTNITPSQTASQAYDSSGVWNFLQTNAPAPTSITANAKVSTYTGEDAECVPASTKDKNSQCIVNKNSQPIAPINVLRVDSWGNDQNNSASVANNTDLVSINYSVLSQLKTGDVRGNYIQTGGIWTSEGQLPPNGADPDLRGSLNLANTTMETFYQFHDSAPNAFNPVNCFGCHGVNVTKANANTISHIFDAMKPLKAHKK